MKCAKMKVGLGALAVVTGLAVALLGFTKAGGLIEVAWNKLGLQVNHAVPLEFEIERIANEVTKLSGDIKDNKNAVIKEEVATERLRDEAKVTRKNLDERFEDLKKMKAALDSGDSLVKIGNTTLKADTVRAKFHQDWESYKSAEAALKAKENLVEQKQKQIDTARARIAEMQAQQDQLRTQVEKMKADLETAKLVQAQSDVAVDDSRLANIKSSMADVNDQIKVLVKQAEENGKFTAKEPTVEDALKGAKAEDEFDAYAGAKVNK